MHYAFTPIATKENAVINRTCPFLCDYPVKSLFQLNIALRTSSEFSIHRNFMGAQQKEHHSKIDKRLITMWL